MIYMLFKWSCQNLICTIIADHESPLTDCGDLSISVVWLPVMPAARRTLKCFLLLMFFTYLKQNRKNSPRLQPDVPVPAVVPSYGYDHLSRGTDYNARRVAGCRDNS